MVLVRLTSCPLIATAWLLVPWAVRLLIPRDLEATFLIQLFLFMLPIFALRIPTDVLWVAARLADCFIGVVFGFTVFIARACTFYRVGWGMPGVAIAFVAASCLFPRVLGVHF